MRDPDDGSDDHPADDPSLAWGFAIREWQRGRSEHVAAAIATLPVPAFAAEFLIDLATGSAKRDKGRPPERTPNAERELLFAMLAEWDRLEESGAADARNTAIETVAARHHISDGAVRGIVTRCVASWLMSEPGEILKFWRALIKVRASDHR